MVVFLNHMISDGLAGAMKSKFAQATDDDWLRLVDVEIELLEELS
jgi:hypothetical protein